MAVPGRRASVAALAVYALARIPLLRPRPLIEPGRQYIGVFDDPQIPIWSFAWWLHAIEHGHNPLVTPRALGAERRRPRLGEHGAGARGRVRAADRAARARSPPTTSPPCSCRRSPPGRRSCSAATSPARSGPRSSAATCSASRATCSGTSLGQPQLTAVFADPAGRARRRARASRESLDRRGFVAPARPAARAPALPRRPRSPSR